MLSDFEQRRLSEIERDLRSDDPEFVERFGHLLQVPPGRPGKWGATSARSWLIGALVMTCFAVLTANMLFVLLAMCVAAVSAALWLTGDSRSGGS